MRRHITLTGALTLAIAATASIATTPPPGPAPTVIGNTEASVNGGTVTVTSTIDFGGQAPVVLGVDAIGDAPGQATGQTASRGLDLTEIRAYVADGDVPLLTMEWQATQLDEAPPNEVIRYYWQFGTPGGGFAVQAKTSDVVSAGNADQDPAVVAARAQSYVSEYQKRGHLPKFRVRGNCGSVTPVVSVMTNCGHVAWVEGEFDLAKDTIRVHLPLDLANATSIRPGVTLTADPSGAYSAIQVASDNANTRDTVLQDAPFTIPVRTATVQLLDGSGAVVKAANMTVGSGSASGTLTGVAAGPYNARVTACFAGNCATSTTPVTVG